MIKHKYWLLILTQFYFSVNKKLLISADTNVGADTLCITAQTHMDFQ